MHRSIYLKYVILIAITIISGLILLFSESIIFHIFALLILCIGALIIAEFNLMHPYFWYSVGFTLYSISYPILFNAGLTKTYGYSKELMILQWLALVTFLFVVTPKKALPIKKEKLTTNTIFIKKLYSVIYIILIFAVISIISGGFANKREIYSEGSTLHLIAFRGAILLTILYVYKTINFYLGNNNLLEKKLLLKTFIILFLITAFSGERSILFTFICVSIFTLYYFKKIRNKHLLLLAPIGIIALPLTHIYKYFALTGTVNSQRTLGFDSLFYQFLKGEFESASRNLMVLLNNESSTKGIFNGFTIINDFMRIVTPDTGFRTVRWYADTFFPGQTTGYGFTLVGEGYINWGYAGVIVVFVILGLIVRFFYQKSGKNIYFLTIYIYIIPLTIYSTRADLANVFSPFVKHLLLSILLIIVLEWLAKISTSDKHKEKLSSIVRKG